MSRMDDLIERVATLVADNLTSDEQSQFLDALDRKLTANQAQSEKPEAMGSDRRAFDAADGSGFASRWGANATRITVI